MTATFDTAPLDLDDIEFHDHDALRLIRALRGPGAFTVRIYCYPDHPKAGLPFKTEWAFTNDPDQDRVPLELKKANERGLAIGWIPERCIYTDIDGGAQAREGGPAATAVVQSANGQHLYFGYTDGAPEDSEVLTALRSACMFHTGDPAVAQIDHVLRLPGFKHQKNPDKPIDVVLVKEPDPSASGSLADLVKGFPRNHRKGWASYEAWNRVRKVLGDAAGAFGSPEWTQNEDAAVAYATTLPEYKETTNHDMPAWVSGHDPAYWWGYLTCARLLRAMSIYGVNRESFLPADSDPATPEWATKIEPKGRIWLAHIAEREAMAKDGPAMVAPFDPAVITDEEAVHAPKWNRPKKGGINLRRVDVVGLFTALGLYVKPDKEDRHIVKCPWADQHTDKAADEAAIWVATKDRAAGFKCLHGHCADRTMRDVLAEASPAVVSRFVEGAEIGSLRVGLVFGQPDWPVVLKSKEKVSPAPNRLENTEALLRHYGVKARYNTMTKWAEIDVKGELHDGNVADATILEAARRHGYSLSRDVYEQHMSLLLHKAKAHPVAEWIDSKPWDGQTRLPALVASLTLADTDPAAVSLSTTMIRKWMIAAVAAIFEAGGAKVENVLTLVGKQGCGKTRWISSLAPDRSWLATGVTLNPGEKDSVLGALHHWICELGELDATFRKTDISKLKGFLSMTRDIIRPPYGHQDERWPRQTVFCASVNDSSFLVDATGNRRYWTIEVTKCDPKHGLDMQQVWAEATALYRDKEDWWLDSDDEAALAVRNDRHRTDDPIYDALVSAFTVRADGWVSQPDIIKAVKEAASVTWTQRESRQVVTALRRLTGRQPIMRQGVPGWAVASRKGTKTEQASAPLDIGDQIDAAIADRVFN